MGFPGVSLWLWYTDELWSDPPALKTFGYAGMLFLSVVNEIFFQEGSFSIFNLVHVLYS